MRVAFDIGGSRIRAARVEGRKVSPLGEAATPGADYEAFLGTIATLAGDADGIAISIAGVVDPETGRLKVANIPGADGRPLARDLAVRLGRPVRVLNDADCFALAEARHGAGRGHCNVFGIILGTGVGGGLVIDGRVIEGAGGYAGEWGHGPVLPDRIKGRDLPVLDCGCGQRGCVDTVGGARGMERLHRHLYGAELTSADLLARWVAGEVDAGQTLDIWLDLVAGPLAMVLNVVGASVVPVGGGLSNVPELVAALDARVRARVLRPGTGPLLCPAECPGEPGLIGAAEGFDAIHPA